MKKSSDKYTEAKDKKADAKLTKNLSPAQRAKFMKADAKHKNVKTMAQDAKIDNKILRSVKGSKRRK